MSFLLKRAMAVLLFLGMATGWAMADVVEQLYDSSQPVSDQSAAARKQAAGKGLEEVFVRVSGRRDIHGAASLVEAMASPERYLTQYNYQRRIDSAGETEVFLKLRYSAKLVNASLQAAGMPVWSDRRPSVLVWVLADSAAGRRFAGSNVDGAVYTSLLAEAKRRGLALQFPLFDLMDAGSLSQDQLWRLSIEDVRQASARYKPPYILMGRASELSTGQWLASWVVIDGESTIRLESQGDSAVEMVSFAIDLLADNQAQRYAVVGGAAASSGTLIQVGGVNSFDDYAKLITYLEGLAVIRDANAVWMKDGELILELVLNDDMSKVQRFLSLDGRLQESASAAVPDGGSGFAVRAHYQWASRNGY